MSQLTPSKWQSHTLLWLELFSNIFKTNFRNNFLHMNYCIWKIFNSHCEYESIPSHDSLILNIFQIRKIVGFDNGKHSQKDKQSPLWSGLSLCCRFITYFNKLDQTDNRLISSAYSAPSQNPHMNTLMKMYFKFQIKYTY